MDITLDDVSAQDIYKLMIGAIQPRPIAWVCTRNRRGQLNLAPFSFFTLASVNPPVIAFSPLLKADGREKDTVRNLRENPEFTLNIVSHALVGPMNQTSAALPYGDSEIVHAGLNTAPSKVIDTPRIREALVHFECGVRELHSFGDQPLAGRLVLGDVRHVHVDDALYDLGRIRSDRLDAVGRLAGDVYATTRDTFEIERPA